jgi:hypothetical protein
MYRQIQFGGWQLEQFITTLKSELHPKNMYLQLYTASYVIPLLLLNLSTMRLLQCVH